MVPRARGRRGPHAGRDRVRRRRARHVLDEHRRDRRCRPDLSGQTVEVAATWTGAEQKNFEQVLDLFEEQTGATVRFLSAGDDVAAYLGPKIEGGQPPDVAILPQPGVVQTLRPTAT